VTLRHWVNVSQHVEKTSKKSAWPLKMNAPQSFETSVTTHTTTRCHMPEDLNPHITVLYEIKHSDNLLHVSICCKYPVSGGDGKPLCTMLLTGLKTRYGALATFLNMIQVFTVVPCI
jgi:hypothetical protein